MRKEKKTVSSKGLLNEFLPASRDGGFRMEGYWVWCGSVIKGEDGRYHMFASRWPMNLPAHPGWIIASEVVRAVSENPEGPYSFQEVVLPPRGAEYWDGRMTHNPHITRFEDTYLLYYTGSTHPFPGVTQGEPLDNNDSRVIVGRANKRVGVAVAKSIFGPWKRMDTPILPTRPGRFDSYLTSNPAPCINPDGSVLLVYKARAYEGEGCGRMTIGAAWADHYLGHYRVMDDKPIFDPKLFHLEDPFIWRDNEGYKMAIKDMTSDFSGEERAGIFAFSSDGLNWTVPENPKAYSRTVVWDDGKTEVLGNFERPFILFEDGKPAYIFGAISNGSKGLLNPTETRNMVIPIKTT